MVLGRWTCDETARLSNQKHNFFSPRYAEVPESGEAMDTSFTSNSFVNSDRDSTLPLYAICSAICFASPLICLNNFDIAARSSIRLSKRSKARNYSVVSTKSGTHADEITRRGDAVRLTWKNVNVYVEKSGSIFSRKKKNENVKQILHNGMTFIYLSRNQQWLLQQFVQY